MAITALVVVIAVCFLCLSARAEWHSYDELPEWIHRGNLRWVQARAKDMEEARSLVEQGFNLLWGSGWTSDPEVVAFLEENGVHWTDYVCSTSILWHPGEKEDCSLERFPPLRQATALDADGSRKVIYDNLWDRQGDTARFAGCRLSPEWLTHQKRRMTLAAQGGRPFPEDPVYSKLESELAHPLHVFFLDNPFLIKCYCRRCQEAWAKHCRERFGVFVPDPERCPDERIRNAWDYFWLDVNAEYVRKLKAIARAMAPPRFVIPNWLQGYPEYYYLMQKAGPDAVLIELGGGGERPWGRSEFPYKVAAAATDGKALTNIHCFRPARPRLDLRRRPYPLLWGEDVPAGYLTCAEAASCLASYLTTGPESFNRFLKDHRNLDADAQPAEEIAVLYSIATELWRRRRWGVDPLNFLGPHWWIGMDYSPSAHVKHLADRLTGLGVPYDVIVERDLTAAQLAAYRCIVLPDVQCLEPEQAEALEQYVRSGGSVIVAENLGTRDGEGNLLSRAESAGRAGPLATVDRLVSLVPAADLALEGYVPDGAGGRIAAPSSGVRQQPPRARLCINRGMLPDGPGPYDLKVRYFDSSLGKGSIRLTLNEQPLAAWALDRQSDEFHWGTVRGVELGDGDTLLLEATPEGGELCRIQEVRIQRPAETRELDGGSVVFEPDRLTDVPKERLLSHLREAGGLRCRWHVEDASEDVFVNFLRPAGTEVLALHILNATVRDHHHATILDHADCAARKTIALSEEERGALAQPVVSLLGFTPYWTQTYMAREVAAQPFRHKDQTQAWLSVAVNGTQVGRLRLGGIEDGWTDVPFDPELLDAENVVEVRVTGDVGYRRSYFGLLIDTEGRDGASEWVPSPWPEHGPEAPNDLSPYEGVQSGSYMIVIHNEGDEAALPAYKPAHTPVSDISIMIPEDFAREPAATLISPDAEGAAPATVTGVAGGVRISVPQVDVYGVLLLARSDGEIRRLLSRAED